MIEIMKITKFKEEINSLTPEQLEPKSHELRKELFSLGLNASTSHVKDYSHFKKLRKNIARVLTLLHQKTSE